MDWITARRFWTGLVWMMIGASVGISRLEAAETIISETLVNAVATGYSVSAGDVFMFSDRDNGIFDTLAGTGTANGRSRIANNANTHTFVLRIGDTIYPKQWGLIYNVDNAPTRTENNAVLLLIRNHVAAQSDGQRSAIDWGVGEIHYSSSPNWWISGLQMSGRGVYATLFRYHGNGQAFYLSPTSQGQGFKSGLNFRDFFVDCGSAATAGMYLVNVSHSLFQNIQVIHGSSSCIAWDLQLNVLNQFNTCGVPLDRFTTSARPQECLRLAASFDGSNTTACTFINFIAEGATAAGIRLINADNNVFHGGTAESNTGRGVLVASLQCRDNTFIGLDMEANTLENFNDAGDSTIWENCLALNSAAVVSGSSRLCKINGGLYNRITVETGAVAAVISDVHVNTQGTGGLTDNGTDTAKRNVRDRTAGTFVIDADTRVGASITASPYTYTNNTRQIQNVYITGQPVTSVTWKRTNAQGPDSLLVGNNGTAGPANGLFTIAPGDSLVIVYPGSAPAVGAIPLGTQSH